MKHIQPATSTTQPKIHERTIHKKINFDEMIEETKDDVLLKKPFIQNTPKGFMTIRIPSIEQLTEPFKDSLRAWLYNMGFKIVAEIENENEWAIKMNLRPYQGGIN